VRHRPSKYGVPHSLRSGLLVWLGKLHCRESDVAERQAWAHSHALGAVVCQPRLRQRESALPRLHWAMVLLALALELPDGWAPRIERPTAPTPHETAVDVPTSPVRRNRLRVDGSELASQLAEVGVAEIEAEAEAAATAEWNRKALPGPAVLLQDHPRKLLLARQPGQPSRS
jgi:hypothetical protein